MEDNIGSVANSMTTDRPSWDEYFLLISFIVSLRSQDPNIQHGAVIVDDLNHIIGTGYNGPIKSSKDDIIPWSNRDEKRKWMIHAEENAILNCTKTVSINNNYKMYITGLPCNNCLQRIINFGVKKIVIAERKGSITENNESEHMRKLLLEMSALEVRVIPMSNFWLKEYGSGVI